MSLLEVITKASSAIPTLPDQEANHPVVFNPDPIFIKLKPETDGSQADKPIKKVTGWEIAQIDQELAQLGQTFFKQLRRKLKNTNSFSKFEFLNMLSSHLEKIADKVGISLYLNRAEQGYACQLVEKLGILLGREAKGLVLEGCIGMEIWDILECFIFNKFVEHSHTSILVHKLIEKLKSDLIVLCVKHLDLQTYDLMCILKYFLALPVDGYKNLVNVRRDWENQAFLAIEKASGKGVSGKEKGLAKEAALLVMLGHDGFSVSELSLHYFLASPNLDEVILSACVSKLNGEEIRTLIQYLGKWLRKYERFPQVGPSPKASSALGLEVCDWIPTLETVAKCLGVVVDEHFSSFVLHSEFDELRSLEGVVSSLAAEARLCGALANLTEKLRIEHKDYNRDALGNFAL